MKPAYFTTFLAGVDPLVSFSDIQEDLMRNYRGICKIDKPSDPRKGFIFVHFLDERDQEEFMKYGKRSRCQTIPQGWISETLLANWGSEKAFCQKCAQLLNWRGSIPSGFKIRAGESGVHRLRPKNKQISLIRLRDHVDDRDGPVPQLSGKNRGKQCDPKSKITQIHGAKISSARCASGLRV